MSVNLPTPTKRIITEVGPDGLSRIVEEGPSPNIRTMPERPGYQVSNIWRTLPGGGAYDPDTITEHVGIAPPPGGVILRVIDIPPEPTDPEERDRGIKAMFAGMFNDADHDSNARHPGMHATDTVDFAILLEGELVAMMDEGETTMSAGDILIQRGTNHAWSNRSGKNARIVFVLIDAPRKK
jgi:hypothetical protein